MILVTGATGNIGRHVVDLLQAQGAPVRVFVRDPAKVAHLEGTIERAVGDFTQPETLAAAMRGVDKVFLLFAGEQGATTTVDAVAAATRAGVRHIVLLSSATVLIPGTKIGVWHREREVVVERSGVPWTFVRPGGFMANALRWAESIRAQGAVFQAHGHGRSAPIHEYDMAAVSAVALTTPGHEGQSYALSGPEAISAAEQVDAIAKVLGRTLKFVDAPEAAAFEGMKRSGMTDEMAEAVLELVRLGTSGRAPSVSPWVEKLTGRPARTFAQWASEHADAFR